MSHKVRIGIVGGGPGGLMTAYFLQKYATHPLQLTLIEASDRLGGKIQTSKFSNSEMSYEAGAAEFYDYSHIDDDPLKELIAELGLSTTRMEGTSVVVGNQLISNLDDLTPDCAKALLTFDRRARGMQTPREFYLANDLGQLKNSNVGLPFQPLIDGIANPQTKHYIETLIHSDLATEPDHTNLEYGLQNYLMNDPRYMRLYSIVGGNERLIEELAKWIRAEVLLNHFADEVGLDSNGRMRVGLRSGEHHFERTFDQLVLALPHQALCKVTFQGQRLSEAFRRHLTHYNHPAHYLRITISFKQPSWRSRFPDSFMMIDQFGGCCLYDESLRDPSCNGGVLGWLIAGENAEEMSLWDDQQLIEAALDSLPAFFPDARPDFIEGRIHRWIGAVSAMPGGWSAVPLEQRHQPEPQDHAKLFVVGDYLFDSTLNGVLDSADYVSKWMISSNNEQGALRHDDDRTTVASRNIGTGLDLFGSGNQIPISNSGLTCASPSPCSTFGK